MTVNFVIIGIVVLYLIGMLFIGWYSSKNVSSNEDFMVAGRRLGPVLMAGTLAATEIGGGSSLGVVQKGMNPSFGLNSAWYIIAMGLAFVVLTFIAPKIRNSMVKTVPEYFRRRYGEAAGAITALIMFVPLIGLTAGQFIASAVILSTMLGISYHTAVIIVGIVVTIYAVMGGLWSVTLTDFVQVFLIVIGMIIAVPFALNYAGGWENVKANVDPAALNIIGQGSGYGLKSIISLTIMYIGTFTVGQEAVSRYYAARDGKAAVQGSILAAIINFVFAFIPAVLGVIVLALVNMGRFDANHFAAVGARYALPVLAIEVMPSVICALLFAGIISATMSSADSDLLGAGSIFANDLYRAIFKKDASDKEVLNCTRGMMVVVGALSLVLAYFNNNDIISILTFAFTLRAAGTFFPYVLGHYWKGSSTAGTIASLIAGTIVVVGIDTFKWTLFGYKFEQSIVPGLVVAFIAFIVFSLIFPPKEKTTELKPE